MARGGNKDHAQRIGAGTLRGRKLLPVPAGISGVRPTGSKVRSAIFDRLQFEVRGARVLDAFAGSGALAIEAISRGAAAATCVELDVPTATFLRRQIDTLDLSGRIEVVSGDVRAFLREGRGDRERYDLVLVDPPYADRDAYARTLAALASCDWLAEDAIVVCELMPALLAGLAWPESFALEARREHGQTALDFLRFQGKDQT